MNNLNLLVYFWHVINFSVIFYVVCVCVCVYDPTFMPIMTTMETFFCKMGVWWQKFEQWLNEVWAVALAHNHQNHQKNCVRSNLKAWWCNRWKYSSLCGSDGSNSCCCCCCCCCRRCFQWWVGVSLFIFIYLLAFTALLFCFFIPLPLSSTQTHTYREI